MPSAQHQQEVVAMVLLLQVEGLIIVIKRHHLLRIEVQGAKKRRVNDAIQAHLDLGRDQGHVIDLQERVVIEIETLAEVPVLMRSAINDQNEGHDQDHHLLHQENRKNDAIKTNLCIWPF